MLGLFGASTFVAPYSEMSIIFLPFFSLPSYQFMMALVALDLVGLVQRWRSLDHAGHLGGVLGGVAMLALFAAVTGIVPTWLAQRLG